MSDLTVVSENGDVEDGSMSEDELLKAVRVELDAADQIIQSEDMEEALDYYNAELPEPFEDETDNEYSDVVSQEVRNAIEATIAEVMPGFYGDLPVTFLPMGPQDEKQVESESHIVNHVFMEANNGYSVLNRAFKDAMLFRDGIISVTWEEKTNITGRRMRGVPITVIPQLMQDISGAERDGEGTYTVDLVKSQKMGKPTVEWVPCDQIRVNADHYDVCLDSARFVARVRGITASDLVAAGVPKDIVDDLSPVAADPSTLKSDDNLLATVSNPIDKSRRIIMVAECYYHVDVDGDGIGELRRIWTAGGYRGHDKLLHQEPWTEQPFCHGIAFYSPRGWRGVSLQERLKDIQDYKSDMIRQILDAGWRNLNQRIGVLERQVNVSDLQTSKRGGIVRMKSADALQPIPDVQLPNQVFSVLQMLDKMRRESGGGAIDTAPQAQEIGVDSAHGLERIMSAIEETNAALAKNLAETIVVSVYKKLHRVLRTYWPGVISQKVAGSWLQQVPRQWAERNDTSVAVGLSTGTRLKQAAVLQSIIAQQDKDMSEGRDGILVNPQGMYAARIALARLSGIPFPEQYWVDPTSQQGQQAAQTKQQSAEKAKQEAFAMQKMQFDTLKEVEQIRGQFRIMEAQMDNKLKEYEDSVKMLAGIVDQRLKLIELNAKYDDEPVPNSVPRPNTGGN